MPRPGPRKPTSSDDPRPEDIEAFSDATRPCPKCRTTLYDDVELCWKCAYAVNTREQDAGVPKWAIITALVLLGLFIIPMLMRFI
jgi:uncharacterized paraquat-inducible protein A